MIGIFEWLMILAAQSPVLLFWIAVLIFAIVMLRRGGGRAERFFIAGAGTKILGNLLNLPWIPISLWFHRNDYDIDYITSISTGVSIFLGIIGMVGILLLFYAFWLKFNEIKTSDNHVENL
jgi:uncharacterized membrane protein